MTVALCVNCSQIWTSVPLATDSALTSAPTPPAVSAARVAPDSCWLETAAPVLVGPP